MLFRSVLYTCYPFGILTHTPQRYAVYADPVNADEYLSLIHISVGFS